MVDLRAKPFNLDDDGIAWVNNTLNKMTTHDKIGQLFFPVGFTTDENAIKALTGQMKIAGIMYRSGKGEEVQKVHKMLQDSSEIPLLLAANLEAGGAGIAVDGTVYGKPLQVAATNDYESGYRLGKISCSEGAAVGCNYAFAPIVDIDMNFRNPITNLRTFGSNVDKVINMSKGYLRAADECNVAVSIKHFPGDGVDERDQHLITSVNSLTTDEWDKTYGRVYEELIDFGAKTVMIAHITQPAYSKHFNPSLKDDEILPGSLSKELLQDLLRDKLGFNGVIISDATPMLGFTVAMKREDAVPNCIKAGCDLFLFNKNIEEDFSYMMAGYQKGIISDDRLNDAVTRTLALKASLGLHTKKKDGTLVPEKAALSILNCEQHQKWAKECADKSVTLIKDTQKLLPINPTKHKRIWLNVLEASDSLESPLRVIFKTLLEKEGFNVDLRNRDVGFDIMGMMATGEFTPRALEILNEMQQKVSDFSDAYDLAIYVSNFETASNNTVVRIAWKGLMGMGNDSPWFTAEVPTLFISLANPYHLLDVPMIKTFINAYTYTDNVVEAVVDKILGKSKFKGVSPVDASCGRTDTML